MSDLCTCGGPNGCLIHAPVQYKVINETYVPREPKGKINHIISLTEAELRDLNDDKPIHIHLAGAYSATIYPAGVDPHG